MLKDWREDSRLSFWRKFFSIFAKFAACQKSYSCFSLFYRDAAALWTSRWRYSARFKVKISVYWALRICQVQIFQNLFIYVKENDIKKLTRNNGLRRQTRRHSSSNICESTKERLNNTELKRLLCTDKIFRSQIRPEILMNFDKYRGKMHVTWECKLILRNEQLR